RQKKRPSVCEGLGKVGPVTQRMALTGALSPIEKSLRPTPTAIWIGRCRLVHRALTPSSRKFARKGALLASTSERNSSVPEYEDFLPNCRSLAVSIRGARLVV